MGSYLRGDVPGHVFISYVREDRQRVDRLQAILEQAGINVWRDTGNLWPGQDWQIEIRRAIMSGSLAFIACFSENSEVKGVSYQNTELILAVEQMQRRPPGRPWLIPVRFAQCSIPVFDLGANRTLESLHHIDLFDGSWEGALPRLIAAIVNILQDQAKLAQPMPSTAQGEALTPDVPMLRVRPHFIDLGIMKYCAAYRAYIEVVISSNRDSQWVYEVSNDVLEAHRRDEGILIYATPRPGEMHTSIRIRNNSGEVATVVEISGECKEKSSSEPIGQNDLTMDAIASDSAPSVTEDQARSILQAWLSGTSGIPTDLFDGTLDIRNATSARLQVRHIFEHRREYEIEGRKTPTVAYKEIDFVRSPISWSDQTLEGFLSGSKRTIPCKNCMATGSVRCKDCGGMGGRLCPPLAACASCSGTGIRGEDSTRCQSCKGSGNARCTKCNGSGRIECGPCKGSGRQRCGNCMGSGTVFQYVRGTVSRVANIKSMRTDQHSAAAAAVACAAESSYQELLLRQDQAYELPTPLQGFFSAEMDGSWAPEELARMAEFHILQAVSVAYSYGDYHGIAYITGQERTVHINLSKQDRRKLRLINAGSRYNLMKLTIKRANDTMKSSAKAGTNSIRGRWAKKRQNEK